MLDDCLRELQTATIQLIEGQLLRWRTRSEGEGVPTSDEVSLFFAFYGADTTWTALLNEAEGMCVPAI